MTLRGYFIAMGMGATGSFLALWAWIALLPLAYLDPEYPYWRAKQHLTRACDLGDLLILGDSRAAVGILPERLPVRATNLAVGGGKPVEALAALRRALACPDAPAGVLLSLDPGHLMRPDLFWERSVRYGLVGVDDLRELAALSAETGDWSVHEARQVDRLPPALRAWLYQLRFPPYYFNSVLRSGLFLRWPANHAAYRRGIASRGQYYFGDAAGSDGIALDATLPGFQPTPVLDAAFDRLLAVLGERGIPAWFVPIPVNEATWRATSPDVAAGFDTWLRAKAMRFPLFEVVPVADPWWPNAWFGDAFAHLNPAGAARFSEALATRLAAHPAARGVASSQRLQAAPPRTQNDAQNGWFSDTERDASASVAPSSNRGS